MKAAIIHSYGDIGVLEIADMPVPEMGDDEVLVGGAAENTTAPNADIHDGCPAHVFIRDDGAVGGIRPRLSV